MESRSLYCISRKGNVYFQGWKGKLSFTEIFRKFLAKQENTVCMDFFGVWFFPLFLFGRVEAARCIISCYSTFQLWVIFPVYTPYESVSSLDCFKGCSMLPDLTSLNSVFFPFQGSWSWKHFCFVHADAYNMASLPVHAEQVTTEWGRKNR